MPAGTQPPISAAYSGDSQFAPSSGRPTNRFAAPPATTTTTTTTTTSQSEAPTPCQAAGGNLGGASDGSVGCCTGGTGGTGGTIGGCCPADPGGGTPFGGGNLGGTGGTIGGCCPADPGGGTPFGGGNLGGTGGTIGGCCPADPGGGTPFGGGNLGGTGGTIGGGNLGGTGGTIGGCCPADPGGGTPFGGGNLGGTGGTIGGGASGTVGGGTGNFGGSLVMGLSSPFGLARAAGANPTRINPTSFFTVPAVCSVPHRTPIDAQKAAQKAYDSGFSASLSQSSAANGAIGTGIGYASKLPGPQAPYVSAVGDTFSLAAALESQAAKDAATRAADPPDPSFRKLSAVRAYPVPLGDAVRQLAAATRRRLLLVARLAGTAAALATNATISINRAASAHAAHRHVWERRQMLADARFSAQLAVVLSREATAVRSLPRLLLTARLGSRLLSAADVSAVARSASRRGLSVTLTHVLRQLHVAAGGRRFLRVLIAGVRAAAGTRITYRIVVTQALNSSAAVLRSYAADLHAYALRVRKRPVSSSAS